MFRIVGYRIAFALLIAGALAGCSVEARKARHLAHGEEYFKAGDYEKAKIEYIKLLLADPRNDLPFRRLGFIWAEEGAPLRAAPFLLKARDLAPTDVGNRVILARTFMALGRSSEARKEVLAALEQDPQQGDTLILLADSDQTKEDLDYTDQYLKKLLATDSLSVLLASANVAVQKADFTSAKALLERATSLDSKSYLPHLALAKLDLYQKKFTEAEEEYKIAAQLAPIRSGACLRYAEFKMQAGAGEQVRELLEDAVRQAPDYLPAWISLSQIAANSRKYDEALKVLENVFSRDPQNPEARILEANVLLAKGDTKKAVERFEDLEKRYKDVPIIDYELARAYVQNKNPGQASIALTHAIAAKPDYLDAILLRSELDLRSGNASLVVPSMINVLKQRPHLREAEVLLVEADLSLGRFEEAAAVIRDQISASPDDVDAYYQLGLVLREAKKFDEAKNAFAKVAELRPGNLKAINQLVDLDLAKNDFKSAMSRVQAELQKKPVSAIAYFMEGKTYEAERKFDRAETSLLKALELDPNSLGTYQLLISIYLTTNKLPQAVSQLQSLLSRNPEQPQALMTLASTYEKLNDFEEARDAYEKLLSVNPQSGAALGKLAWLYSEKLNRLDKAYDLADKARTLAPVDPTIADTLGWILYKQRRYEDALNLIREAVDKLPNDPEVQFHFGVANYMNDHPDIARTALKKAATAPVDFSDKEEARGWLAFLEDDSGAAKQLSINELEALVQERPKDLVARTRLAALYEKQSAPEKAAAQYEAALNTNPRLTEATLRLAQLYAGPLHNFSRALELGKMARDMDKGDPRIARLLGKIAYLSGNFGWAYDLLVESAHSRREDPTIAYDLAWAAYSLGKIPESQQTMQRALELGLDPNHSIDAKRFLKLTKLEQKGGPVELTSEIEKELKADPTYVPALMLEAVSEVERGKVDKAMGALNEVLRRFPEFAPAQKDLAALYLDDPKTVNQAYELAIKARNNLPNDAKLALTLGVISYQRNEYDYAAQLLQESAKTQPLDAKGLYYLGMSQFQLQKQAQGKVALERSLAIGLPEPLAADAKRVLAGMRNASN